MERIDKIMSHPVFVENMKRIQEMEIDRVYCRHGFDHSVDVARILYIKVLEEKLDIKKDVIYAAAMLHDIGRGTEYEGGGVHHEVGAKLAGEILADCDYEAHECQVIVDAIKAHKNEKDEELDNVLCKLLYQADKLSRKCFDCDAIGDCYWSKQRKNMTIQY